jgi:hypothetical protein
LGITTNDSENTPENQACGYIHQENNGYQLWLIGERQGVPVGVLDIAPFSQRLVIRLSSANPSDQRFLAAAGQIGWATSTLTDRQLVMVGTLQPAEVRLRALLWPGSPRQPIEGRAAAGVAQFYTTGYLLSLPPRTGPKPTPGVQQALSALIASSGFPKLQPLPTPTFSPNTSPGDRTAIVRVTTAYLLALASGNGRMACSQLTSSAQADLIGHVLPPTQSPLTSGVTCSQAATKISMRLRAARSIWFNARITAVRGFAGNQNAAEVLAAGLGPIAGVQRTVMGWKIDDPISAVLIAEHSIPSSAG